MAPATFVSIPLDGVVGDYGDSQRLLGSAVDPEIFVSQQFHSGQKLPKLAHHRSVQRSAAADDDLVDGAARRDEPR